MQPRRQRAMGVLPFILHTRRGSVFPPQFVVIDRETSQAVINAINNRRPECQAGELNLS